MTRAPLARLARVLLPLAAAGVSIWCGGGSRSGTAPTVPVTTTPTTLPSPTPEPPLSASCARMSAGDPAASCGRETPVFDSALNEAIDTLHDEHPEYFDGIQVHNVGAYFVGVIRILDRRGICAYSTNGEELGIRDNSELSEQYDILSSRAQERRFYVGTCRPAAFPLGEEPLTPPPPGCALQPSRSTACGDPPAQYYGDVEAAIEQILRERPELFDYSDVVAGNIWPRVTDMTAYQRGVGAILTAKGYCGLYGGEEIAIKRTNEFSEHYDINYADAYVRRGEGIYRGACYRAAF